MDDSAANILVISFSPLHRDPRVRRQILLLRDQGYRVTALGFSDPDIEHVKYWRIDPTRKSLSQKIVSALLLKGGLFGTYYSRVSAVRQIKRTRSQHEDARWDLVLANDIDALPIALELANNCPVFFDAHEFSPGEWATWQFNFLFSRYKRWLCRRYLDRPDAMSTVCEGIAEAYADEFGVDVPVVILNAPNYQQIVAGGVDKTRVRLVHHGAALADRRLEVMIDMLALLDDRFTLDFFLMTDFRGGIAYRDQLKERANASGLADRVVFRDPVPTEKIPSTINQYDIGVNPLEPRCLNEELALPNQFFEFVQARLAIAIGPSTEMARLVRKHDLGVVAEDFSAQSMANAISALSPEDILRYTQNSDVAAKELSFDAQAPLFLATVRRLLNND